MTDRPNCSNCQFLESLETLNPGRVAGGPPQPIGRCGAKRISPYKPLVSATTWCNQHQPTTAKENKT